MTGRRVLRYRVPYLEAALANKYGAMLTPSRPYRKRRPDALDFEYMVAHSMEEGRKSIDLNKLAVLGEMVWQNGGGKEILSLVEQTKAGKAVEPDPSGKFIKREKEAE